MRVGDKRRSIPLVKKGDGDYAKVRIGSAKLASLSARICPDYGCRAILPESLVERLGLPIAKLSSGYITYEMDIDSNFYETEINYENDEVVTARLCRVHRFEINGIMIDDHFDAFYIPGRKKVPLTIGGHLLNKFNYQIQDGRLWIDVLNKTHIGKRSAAGFYCFDCKQTLCKSGKRYVNYEASQWHRCCPKCHKTPVQETLETSALGVEIGTNNNITEEKIGVRSCSAFNWAMKREFLADVVQVRNEYDDLFTLEEFMQIVDCCPIQLTHSIGETFE